MRNKNKNINILLNGGSIKKSIDKVVETYEEPVSSVKANAHNEKVVSATMKKIIAHNRKLKRKPINTKILLKSSE